MQVRLGVSSCLAVFFSVSLAIFWSCSDMTDATGKSKEEHLRARIGLAWSHFATGNFEAYVAMWSARMRPSFRESEEDWQKNLRNWRLLLSREKPTFELLDVQITGLRARVKMRVSTFLEKDTSRSFSTVYDYWVFENSDWFLDDASRSE